MESKPSKITQLEGLIEILLDSKAEWTTRDDAASELATYDEPEAEAALMSLACDPETHFGISDSCGQSLAEIWARRNALPIEQINLLRSVALDIAAAVIKEKRPEWKEQIDDLLL